MPLSLDPEFAKALEPLLPALASRPKPAVHDVEGRRTASAAFIGAIFNSMQSPPDVERKEYWTEAADGHKIKIVGFTKKGIESSKPTSAILHVHGGGMILFDVNSLSKGVEANVSATGVPFYSVDYRLAPEHPGTTLVDDSYAGLEWVIAHSRELNIDPARIGVMGESAGGGIAAGVALMARDKNLTPPLAKQILVYPMLDDRNITPDPAIEPFAFWTTDDNITGWTALLGEKAGKPDSDVPIYCSPARAKSLAGLPSTYIDVGTLDIFRDEDLIYAQRLLAENVQVEFHLYPGVPHAYEAIAPTIDITRKTALNRQKAISSF